MIEINGFLYLFSINYIVITIDFLEFAPSILTHFICNERYSVFRHKKSNDIPGGILHMKTALQPLHTNIRFITVYHFVSTLKHIIDQLTDKQTNR